MIQLSPIPVILLLEARNHQTLCTTFSSGTLSLVDPLLPYMQTPAISVRNAGECRWSLSRQATGIKNSKLD